MKPEQPYSLTELVDRLRATFDYIFGPGASEAIPWDRVSLEVSKRSGRVRKVLVDGRLVATVRPDGGIALTVEGARLLLKSESFREFCVVVRREAAEFVAEGRSVFSRYVVRCGARVRPGCEVAVLDEEGRLLAVGVAAVPPSVMIGAESGVAVKVRRGVKEPL